MQFRTGQLAIIIPIERRERLGRVRDFSGIELAVFVRIQSDDQWMHRMRPTRTPGLARRRRGRIARGRRLRHDGR
jgi:hypothetical protein